MKHSETYTSTMRTHVRFYIYEPKVVLRVKGVVQIHHGMGEHADLYDHFASFLLNQGFVVVVSDFAGHGKSLIDFEQGYFGDHNGPQNLVKDMHHLLQIIRERYTDVPYFMLGENLGSVLIRQYVTQYGDYIDGMILLGTPAKVAHRYTKGAYLYVMRHFKGPMYKAHRYFQELHRYHNKKISDDDELGWWSSDQEERKKYLSDPMTHFSYTIQGYRDIVELTKAVNTAEGIAKTPEYLSIYIGVGEFDPFCQGADQLAKKFENNNIHDVTYRVFKGRRHALLFEKNKKEVYLDILQWLNERTYL